MQNLKYLLKRFLYLLYGEKCFKKKNYSWSQYPLRFEIINKIITKKNYKSYLEIGCFKNENFSEIKLNNKVGVDPVSGGTLRMTSDQFFKENLKMFDIIFIDGLHVYEQVKKDISNSLKILNEYGILIIHDCLPRKIWYQNPSRMSRTWNGDVWKALVECRTLKHIDTYTCLADEGLGIIKKRTNTNHLEISEINFKKLKYRDYIKHHNKFMNIINHNQLINEIS